MARPAVPQLGPDGEPLLDENGRPIDEEELDLGDNVLIVDPTERILQANGVSQDEEEEEAEE